MSKKYIIGIDGGSQSTKVVMYDLEGNVVCEGKGLLQPMHTPVLKIGRASCRERV